MLPVICGCSPGAGCEERVAPPKTTWPEAMRGLRFERCAGRAERRLESEEAWSGMWISHSFWEEEEVVMMEGVVVKARSNGGRWCSWIESEEVRCTEGAGYEHLRGGVRSSLQITALLPCKLILMLAGVC